MFFGIVLFGTLVFFLVFGTPIAVAVGLATILGMLTAGDVNALPAITQKMFTSLDSFPLLALPLFTLSGELMEKISQIYENVFQKVASCICVYNNYFERLFWSNFWFSACNSSCNWWNHD